MAAQITKKYGTGDGYFIADVDSSVQTNPHTIKPIVHVEINKVAWDALHANAKTDIGGTTILDIINASYT